MMEFIRKYIINNYKLKGLSVFLAAMLWFAISNIGESSLTVSVPLLTKNLGKDFMMKKMEADAVLVTINGPISILKNLRARDIRLVVNLSSAKEGAYVFTLHKGDVTVPKGIKVETIKPDYTAIEIDKVVEKRLRSVVKLDDRWVGIYSVKEWYPRQVAVEGAQDSLSDKNVIETIPVDGPFVNREEEIDVPLDTRGMIVRKVRPETVRVYLRRD
jgi:YbbR domain-containing protein